VAIPQIREHYFNNSKSEVELELRICLLLNAKDIKNIGEKELKEFKKNHSNHASAKKIKD